MKGKNSSGELIGNDSLLLTWQQRAVIGRNSATRDFRSSPPLCGGSGRISIAGSQLVELFNEKVPFPQTCWYLEQNSFVRKIFQDAHGRLVPQQRYIHIQRLANRRCNQLLGRISKTQAERWTENGLCKQSTSEKAGQPRITNQAMKSPSRLLMFRNTPTARGLTTQRRGFVLVEAMMSLSILTIIGLVLLKMALNVLAPRQWTMQQSVSDAYMTFERALAERIPFDALNGDPSLWPLFPATASIQVEIGRMPRILPEFPNGVPIMATVVRSRSPDPGNYPVDGGIGTLVTNPAAMKIWKAQSVLTYSVGGRMYAKSRTVMRSQ